MKLRARMTRSLVIFVVGTLFVPMGSLAFPQLLNQAQAGAITTSGLIFNLDANDANSYGGSGTEWKDLSGNAYHATLLSPGSGYTLTYDSSANKAMTFANQSRSSNDANGAYARISKTIPNQTWGGFTATFYANMGSGSANTWSRVFDFSAAGFTHGNGAKGGMFVSRYENSTSLHLGFWNMATNAAGECRATNIITDNAFHHYAVTVDSNGSCIWYKNKNRHQGYWSTGGGTSSTATSGSTGTAVKLPTNDAKTSLLIGRSHWNDRYLNGSIRNLAVYNTALSSDQVTANFDGQTGAYTSAGSTLTTPAAPTVSATSNTLKSISTSWSAIANASSYELKLYSAGGTLLSTTGLTGLTGTSATITASNLASLADSTAYKVSITAVGNGTTFLTSSESTKSDVTTNAPPGSPTISVQPTARTSTFNSTANFTVTATSPDSGTLGYQWQVSTDSGGTWNNAPTGSGATTNSYTTATLAMVANGYRYRVNVTNTKNGATSAAVTSSAVTLTVNKADQSAISLPVLSATSKAYPYSQSSLTVNSVTGGTDTGALTITSVSNGTATGCSYVGTTLSASTSGTCTLTVTKAATTNYNAATTTATFTFTKADQATLSAPILSATSKSFPYSQSPLSVSSATGGSGTGGLSITSVANGTATGCSWNGTTLSASTSGTCTLTITRAGDDNFNATTATATFTFNKANQSALSITSTSVNYNSTLTLTTSGGTGDGEVSYVVNSGNCSISSGVLSNTSAGTCSVTATKAGTTGYDSISSSATTITVNQIAQATLSFIINISSKTSPYSQAVTFTPSGGTGTGAKSYAIVSGGTSTGCALANTTAFNTISATTSGTCLIQLTQAADTNYLVATSSTVTFTFTKANQSELTITVSNFRRGETAIVSTTGGNTSETVTYSVSSGLCSMSGSTISSSGIGSCVLVATRPGDANYELVTGTKTVTVSGSNKAELTSLTITPGMATYNLSTLTYSVSVSNSVSSISFTPTFASSFASATFGGVLLTNGAVKTHSPTSGINTPFNIVVTAEDGVTTKTYIIKITKVVATTTTTSTKPAPTTTPAPTKSPTQPTKIPAVSQSPRITSLSNASGRVGSNVTVNGTNLIGATVRLNGKLASISSNNGTQLVVVIPPGASSGVITVLTSKGSAASTRFTVTP
jgi:hypothetical protein